jgi:hypothetical protein
MFAELKRSITFVSTKQSKKKDMTIASEFQRRAELVENPDFISKMAILAKEIGITAKEWNENKMTILMMFANQYCQLENELA